MLSRDFILSINDLKPEKLEVPEWGGYVYIRKLTGRERGEIESYSRNGKDLSDFRALLAVRCVCDENGKRLFTDADQAAIGQKSAEALDRILLAVTKANALGEQGVREAGES